MSVSQAQELMQTISESNIYSALLNLTFRDFAFFLMVMIACFPVIKITPAVIYYLVVDLARVIRDLVRLAISSIRAVIGLAVLVGVPYLAVQMMKKIEEDSIKFGGGRGTVVITAPNRTLERELIEKLKSGLRS